MIRITLGKKRIEISPFEFDPAFSFTVDHASYWLEASIPRNVADLDPYYLVFRSINGIDKNRQSAIIGILKMVERKLS